MRSALSLSVIVPLLLSFSDMITRIQLRSTCRLYRLAFHTHARSRMGLEDVKFDPLAADPLGAVYVRDWHATFPSGAPRIWPKFRLVVVWRKAEFAELKVLLVRERQADLFFFARLPCIPKAEWTLERYCAGLEARAKAKLSRHNMRKSTRFHHEVFGMLEKESWDVVKGPAWYTVEDLAMILLQRYGAWGLIGGRDDTKDAQEGWKRAMPLRWDRNIDGHVFDASKMEGWYYS